MKLHPDRVNAGNVISRHAPGSVQVNDETWRESVVVPWQGKVQAWRGASAAGMTREHFDQLAELQPELVIFGSGSRIRFPSAELLRALIERGIGFETMDTAAACRTYNVLVGEARRVVAALVIEGE
jgi:uncharacterized protein